jgi:hypothetical protein
MSGAMSFGMGSLMGAGDIAGGLTPTDQIASEATAAQLADVPGYIGAGPTGVSTVGQAISVLEAPAGSMIGTADVAPKTLLGYKLSSPVVKGQVYNPSQLLEMGVAPSTATTMDLAKQKLSDPLTYAPLGVAALTGGLDEPYEYEEPPPRPPVDTGFGRYTLEGGTPREPKTQEELLAIALGGGRENMFEKSYYTRNAAEGGIVGLQQGGMATPQAPSAMSAMLAPPMQQQQPMPMQQQPMPMQGLWVSPNHKVFNLFPINL